MNRLLSLLLVVLLFSSVAYAESVGSIPYAHQWAREYTHAMPNDETRDVGDVDYSLMFLVQSYVLEVGFGHGKEPLQRYPEMNLDLVDDKGEVRASTLNERFGMVGDILEDLRINAAKYIADIALMFEGDNMGRKDMYDVLVYTQSDDGAVSYYIEYNVKSQEYNMYTVNND